MAGTSIQKTYKEETLTLYAKVLINATSTQPTLITDDGASKGFVGAALVNTPSRYELTLEPSINVCNILGISAENTRSPSSGFSSTHIALTAYDYTLGVGANPTKISFRVAPASGASTQMLVNSTLLVTLVITTSNTL